MNSPNLKRCASVSNSCSSRRRLFTTSLSAWDNSKPAKHPKIKRSIPKQSVQARPRVPISCSFFLFCRSPVEPVVLKKLRNFGWRLQSLANHNSGILNFCHYTPTGCYLPFGSFATILAWQKNGCPCTGVRRCSTSWRPSPRSFHRPLQHR